MKKHTRIKYTLLALLALSLLLASCGKEAPQPASDPNGGKSGREQTEGNPQAGTEAETGGKTSSKEAKASTAAESGPEQKPVSAASWKLAYTDHLNEQDPEQWKGYALIYINNDDIPELVKVGNSEAAGCTIATYTDSESKINETVLDRLYFTYIERGNLLCNSEGVMDYYYDIVYSMNDKNLLQMKEEGRYGLLDDSELKTDEAGRPVYKYQWNGEAMTKTEYEKALNEVYDSAKAVPGYDWEKLYTLEETVMKINSLPN